MIDLGVNISELEAAASAIRATADDFGSASTQVRSMDESPASSPAATALLARTLTAMSGALTRAETTLQQTGDQLAANAAAYARTEQALSAWMVPGRGMTGGGSQ